MLSIFVPLILGASVARDVVFLTAAPPEVVSANRALWMEGDPIPEIYGTASGQPATILFADASSMIHPVEDPSITLYTVDKQQGENPLQLERVWFIAQRAALGFGVAAIVAFVLAARLGRPRTA